MAALPSDGFLLIFFVVLVYLWDVTAGSDLSFSFKNFGKGSNFEPQIALLGDAKVVNETLSVQISGSGDSGAGRLVCKKPFSLVAGNSTRTVAFSTYFVFSVPRENGNGFAFFMVPARLPLNFSDPALLGMSEASFSVEFDAFKSERYGDLSSKHGGRDVESKISVKRRHASSINLKLYSGQVLEACINYEASGKRIEVSLRKYGASSAYTPLLSYPIDLSAMWKEDSVVVGLMSSGATSSQKTNIYSWSFMSRGLSNSLHSVPLNTEQFAGTPKEHKRSDCGARIILALIFGAACGALAALFVVFTWGFVRCRMPVMPAVVEVHEAKKLEFRKLDVFVADKTIGDGKK